MARVLVVSDDGRTAVEIVDDELTPDGDVGTIGRCQGCGEEIVDRGHFTDTVKAAEVHVDTRH